MKSFLLITISTALAFTGSTTASARSPGHYNQKGNLLIVDQLNNRVVEVNTNSHAIVWQFGDAGSVAGPTTILWPSDAERDKALTYIACTGIPPGGTPDCPTGCPDNRVIAISKKGRIVRQYGQAGVTGSGTNELNNPVSVRVLPKKHLLITDRGNHRVIAVKRKTNEILWQYGTTGVSGSASNQLNNPACAEQRHNGNIVIADTGNNRIIEVDHHQRIVSQLDSLSDGTSLSNALYAGHLQNPSRTLVADTLNNRILEVDDDGTNVFEYVTNTRPGSVANPNPARAVRAKKSDDTIISDQFNHQVIAINSSGTVVFAFGTIGVAGSGTNELNGPCDAKVIGDYTGLTSPKRTGGSGGGFSGAPGLGGPPGF